MRIAVLSDAHGNVYGLETCIKLIEQDHVEQIVYLGDAFGYGDDGERAFELLREKHACMLLGNHEAMLLGILRIDEQKNRSCRLPQKNCVRPTIIEWIQTLLPYTQMTIDGKRLLFVHGSPYDPLCGYVYMEQAEGLLASLPYDYVFMGHTHRPYLERAGSVCAVNVGSCGLPRDIGNRLSYAVYDSEQDICELRFCMADRMQMKDCFRNASSDVIRCIERK